MIQRREAVDGAGGSHGTADETASPRDTTENGSSRCENTSRSDGSGLSPFARLAGPLAGRDRGVSSPLGLALVFGFVIAGSVLVLSFGSAAIADTEAALNADRSTKVLTQLDSQAAMVALGNSPAQQLSLAGARSGNYVVQEDAGWMNVTVTNASTGHQTSIMNATLGRVAYRDDRRTVAYQGGGVWRHASNGSTMIAPPEFYYRDATLTLPLVTVDGTASIGGSVSVTADGSGVVHYPNTTQNANYTNPLQNGRVEVTVQSQFYQAWGQYFEQRTDGSATLDHQRNTATVTLVVPAGKRTVSTALAATSSGGELTMTGSGSAPSRTDSYDSSLGTYEATKGQGGNITTAGDVTVKGNSLVNGTVESGGFVTTKGNGEINGDVLYADGTTLKSGSVSGTVEQIDDVDGAGSIDSHVATKYAILEDSSTNNNSVAPNITSETLVSGDVSLGPGDYHLERIDLDGETLTLNTTDAGDTIRIGVEDYVYLDNGGTIRIEGTGRVLFYMNADEKTASGHHFEIGGDGGQVNVSDAEDASQFWMYGPSHFQATVDGNSGDTHRFEGVIYAPGGAAGSSHFHIDHGELFGGVVTSSVEMDNGGAIHYDTTLSDQRAIPADESVVQLTYLHVSRNPISVTDA